jgi:hypothetical protein
MSEERLRGASAAAALNDLELHWPDPMFLVEDKGAYDYEECKWAATPYSYDSVEERRIEDPEIVWFRSGVPSA